MDRRIIKTKRAIRNAFAELLTIKNLEDICVKDLADLAEINRKTFYNYYSGINQILEEIENEIVSAFDRALKDITPRDSLKNPYLLFSRLTSIINQDIDFYERLLKSKSNATLMEKLLALLKERMIAYYADQTDLNQKALAVTADFMFAGLLEGYRSWFNSERSQPLEEVSQIMGILCIDGIHGLRNHRSGEA